MINVLRQFVAAGLTLSVLASNGFLLAPVFGSQHGLEKGMGMAHHCCCCCNETGGASSCCCCMQHSKGNVSATCSVSSAPCSAPTAALSPNVLDQWIAPSSPSRYAVLSAGRGEYLGLSTSPLLGIANSLFHPPQSHLS